MHGTEAMTAAADWQADVGTASVETFASTLVERVLEHRFLAELGAALLKRGRIFETLRGDSDRDGYDIVVDACGIMRHIQLKGMKSGGKRFDVTVNTRLASKSSGCVIWMVYDPADYSLLSFKWFGGLPGRSIPPLGDKVARHSRLNSQRIKAERPQHRVVTSARFTRTASLDELVDLLFGPERNILLPHMGLRAPKPDAPEWAGSIRRGDFSALPNTLSWDGSLPLAMLIDGYELAKISGLGDPLEFAERQLAAATPTGSWPGGLTELWITLFLEHRRWRFSSPFEPDEEQVKLLDRLVLQLRHALLKQPR